MVSAKSKEENIVEGLLSGSNGYLVKPFGRQEILARIESHLRFRDAVWRAGDLAGGLGVTRMGERCPWVALREGLERQETWMHASAAGTRPPHFQCQFGAGGEECHACDGHCLVMAIDLRWSLLMDV